MNLLDIIILLILIPAVISGLRKGFISQVVSLLTIILSIVLSSKCSAALSEYLVQYIDVTPKIMTVICFVIIFVVVTIVLVVLGHFLERLITLASLGALNKVLGVLVAVAKYLLVASLVIMLVTTLNTQLHFIKQSVLDSSLLWNPLNQLALDIVPYFKQFFASI